jgi:hypothetical protein
VPVEEWQHAILAAGPDAIEIYIKAESLHQSFRVSAANDVDVLVSPADAVAGCTSNVAMASSV